MATINKKIFLENIPKKGKNIDWSKSVGCDIKFIYGDIEDTFKIIKFIPNEKNSRLHIVYKDEVYITSIAEIRNCNLGKILKQFTNDFKVDIGVYKEKNFTILNRYYKKNNIYNYNNKWYKYKCNICGYEGEMVEGSLICSNGGCPCCSNKVVVLGLNSIYDTHKYLIDVFGLDEEFAKTHSYGTVKKGLFKCKNCGKENMKNIKHVIDFKSIGCTCGDGFSYPEKFMYSVLKQLKVRFETQYSPKYIKPKRSDFYLPNYSLVIETDGILGHKGGKVHNKSNKTLEELIKIDEWKDEQHLKHGVKTIRIDCFESDMEYIKNNILNSELANIFDLSKIEWVECEEFALSNRVKEVCEYYKKNKKIKIKDISNIFKLSNTTITKYLKLGNKHNWCDYTIKKNERSIPIDVYKDGKKVGEFESINSLCENSLKVFGVKFERKSVKMTCEGKYTQHKGYQFLINNTRREDD